MQNLKSLMAMGLLVASLSSFATDSTTVEYSSSELMEMAIFNAYVDSIDNSLQYEYGEQTIGEGLAILTVPAGFKFLNGKDTEMILTDVWGNPPSDPADQSLGMLVPESFSVLSDSNYAINITYSAEGYIKDEDAQDIDYDELLKEMKEDIVLASKQREEMGYESIELVGWASQPFYDAESKKLHWAKELKFGGAEENTLNYNIRILGRKGYLELNVIGDMNILDEVKDNIESLLTNVNFQEGSRYSDFNPSMDKVAAYGIGGLIAGKVLAKAGILAKLGVMLAKFWKVIALAVVGLFAGIKRFFFGGSEEEAETVEEA